MNIVFC